MRCYWQMSGGAMLDKDFFQEHCHILLDYLNNTGSIAIVALADDLSILDCNHFFNKLVGLYEKPLNRNFRDFLQPEGSSVDLDLPENECQSLRFTLVSGNGEQNTIFGSIYRADEGYILFGERTWIEDHQIIEEITKLNNELANMTRELNKKNVALEKANARINDLLRIDDLTGIASRRHFLEFFHKMHAQAVRHNLPLTLVMSDLDYFKAVNDNYGHQYGDMVLIEFARLLKEDCREEDLCARFGGEEFVTLLTHTSLEAGSKQAERIRSKLEIKEIGPQKINITASFGVAALKEGEEVDSLIKRADDALYQAKRSGRNMVCKAG